MSQRKKDFKAITTTTTSITKVQVPVGPKTFTEEQLDTLIEILTVRDEIGSRDRVKMKDRVKAVIYNLGDVLPGKTSREVTDEYDRVQLDIHQKSQMLRTYCQELQVII